MLADAACLESKPNHACHQDTELALRVLKKLPEEWQSCVSHTYPYISQPSEPNVSHVTLAFPRHGAKLAAINKSMR